MKQEVYADPADLTFRIPEHCLGVGLDRTGSLLWINELGDVTQSVQSQQLGTAGPGLHLSTEAWEGPEGKHGKGTVILVSVKRCRSVRPL